MSDRYDTSDHPETRFEPGSGGRVLANKLGVTDPEEMDAIELDLLVQLHDALIDEVTADQGFSSTDLCEWHRRWLGNVYPWAGRYRTLNMAKGEHLFAASARVPRLIDVLDREVLSAHTPCEHMPEERLAAAIATVHVELILIHPFREGNGRLSRLLANLMALQAGRPNLDFGPWDRDKPAYFAAIQAGLDDPGPMMELVTRALRASPAGDPP